MTVLPPFPPGQTTMSTVAETPATGYALNGNAGVQNVITWAAPNDGNLHSFQVGGGSVAASGAGGGVSVRFTLGGQAFAVQIFGANQGTVNAVPGSLVGTVFACDPGTTVRVTQDAALTGGSQKLFLTITAD